MDLSNIWIAAAMVVAGLVMILVGANALTDGASALAKRFNISNLVIGLTVVAFGTSTPELVVSIVSALRGSADMAMGNVVGSNIFNTLLILGCTAAIIPLKVSKSTVNKEIPMSIFASILLCIFANDMIFRNAENNVISRIDGAILLILFVLFMCYSFSIAHNGKDDENVKVKDMKTWKSLLYIIAGLLGLVYGGQFFVEGSSAVARKFGVSESIIGLTLVAGGTSLPELATSVVAAIKKNPGMAIGNVVGSNIFNILLIIGCCSMITPMHISDINTVDYGVLICSGVLLFIFCKFFGGKTIERWEGAAFLLFFAGYMYWLLQSVI